MDTLLSGGKLGEIFTSLAFAGALVSMLGFLFAEKREPGEKRSWERLGLAGFGLHAIGIVGIMGTLFYLIYSHQYQYHYVWSHSSNELPVYYMISCFWEGQEGSFLLWSFWHSILGLVLMFRKNAWRNLVMAVIASVELILASMILGVYAPEWAIQTFFILALLVPAAMLLWKLTKKSELGESGGNGFIFAGFAQLLAGIGLVVTGNTGFSSLVSLSDLFKGGQESLFMLIWLLVIGLGLYQIVAVFVYKMKEGKSQLDSLTILSGIALFLVTVAGIVSEIGATKMGSTPFLLLRDANPDAPIFGVNPDFVPANGTGLNPLLQNYWMVIHPPTLFLGFASTVVPFAFVIAGLIKRQYHEWIRPATPWLIFSVMILGIGIIMGGYWAYETLNFGGYWNWDPVENASLVPWLIGIASIHGMLAYRKSKNFLILTMILVVSTFVFVLYSTFLTRSGILGDTSVHSFTDLGLAGQLLVLLAVYAVSVIVLFVDRWKNIPLQGVEIAFWSKEFFLFLGTLVFIFASIGITFSTSLPVINKLFGTNLAPPLKITFFYYRWNVWFAILMGILSGMGQFLFWKRIEKEALLKAIFRPFLVAIIASSVIIVLVAFNKMDFAFNSEYRDWLEVASLSEGFFNKIGKYLQFGIFVFTDELLLASSLFTIMANLDIMIQLVRKRLKNLKVIGGSLAHIGFGLMLVGILFSSGFDEVVSKNVNPNELGFFEEDDRVDNVLLQKEKGRLINGYFVTYQGRQQALGPIEDLEILEENKNAFKLKFEDARGDVFAIELPKLDFSDYLTEDSVGVDLVYTRDYLNEILDFLNPDHINERSLFKLQFQKVVNKEEKVFVDTTNTFILYPETEVNTANNSILPHPARRIFGDKDLYVHITTIPSNEEFSPEFYRNSWLMGIGDTLHFNDKVLYLKELNPDENSDPYELQATAVVEVEDAEGAIHTAQPVYRITKSGIPRPGNDYIKDLNLVVQFSNIDPVRGLMRINVQEQLTFPEDYVVMNAIHKPFINILWLGTFILTIGFGIAIYRRAAESKSGAAAKSGPKRTGTSGDAGSA